MQKCGKGTVILGGTESDTHVVSLYLAARMLTEQGYSVINRASQNPTADLMAPAEEAVEVLAYVICNQNGHAIEDLRDLLRYRPRSVPIILGGHYTLGCHDKQAQQSQLRALGISHFADHLGDLVPILSQIAARGAAQSDCSRAERAPQCLAACEA